MVNINTQNPVNDPEIIYRGAITHPSEIIADIEAQEDTLKKLDPVLTYRGASMHYSELHPETESPKAERDPIITYRGASIHLSELHS